MPQYPVTIAGNLTADPNFRATPTGNYVCEIRIAASRSIRDENQPSGWRDIDHLFINGELWGQLAENAAASLTKGMAVVATGRIVTQEWEETTQEAGETKTNRRQKIVLKVDRLGLDLSKYVASSRRTDVAQHRVEGLGVPELPNSEDLARKQPPLYGQSEGAENSLPDTRGTNTPGGRQDERELASAGAGGDTAPF
ncbi:single-stranded DNA-binding protein [Corynebacterium doosanense]|uniref:Single-stranded DNA-binding protein n=1 Tax=Corynebacterium doosanense CAU 212 = DSM 45436 TaxID=558173 RepID=A0A097IHU6_9CORY|nr:single-stranded DNA-binding protein [Corynebacterium doosanense]AIT61700.1 single-stranded DNA-binding protein [Corynebacterium doosanense CAU 212 = DSM 45436]